MKQSLMRPPAISDIYNQKMTYENHLKKLSQIRMQRKTQLHFDHNRNSQLQNIKQAKSRTFAHNFNVQNSKITSSNVKFLVKLENVKPHVRHSTHSATERSLRESSFLKPTNKQKQFETEKENSRIFMKMKSVSSTLGRQRMMSDYNKARQIKDRITRFSKENDKVTLKSEKYFSQNKSLVSNRSLSASRDSTKKSLVQHYKKEDIMKNKIVNTEHRLLKSTRQNRGLPSLPAKGIDIEEHNYDYVEEKANEKNSFFTTEPIKKTRAKSQVRKFK